MGRNAIRFADEHKHTSAIGERTARFLVREDAIRECHSPLELLVEVRQHGGSAHPQNVGENRNRNGRENYQRARHISVAVQERHQDASDEQRGDEIVLSVSDSGRGIARNNLPRIFERFYRADKARTPESIRGTGLGLSIVKHIAQLHGGRVDAESELGRGTIVRVVLPVRRAPKRVPVTES